MRAVKVIKGHNQLWQVVTTTWFSWMRKMVVKVMKVKMGLVNVPIVNTNCL